MYLTYRGKTLISEEEFKDFTKRLEIEFEKLQRIYLKYYEEVLCKIYEDADKQLASYLRLGDIVHNIKPLSQEDIEEIAYLVEENKKLTNRYQEAINKDNVQAFVSSLFED